MSTILCVSTPCHENWNKMQPQQNGRHCNACSKVVVDFTGWPLSAIAAYLQSNTAQRTCGRSGLTS